MVTIRPIRPEEGERVVQIWRDAVDATHDFLTPGYRAELDDLVSGFLPRAPLWVAADSDDRPLGFMLIDEGHMEALFVDPACRGTGIGAALVRHGLSLHPAMTTDVNEQNGQAVGFYERMGFRRTGRSELDGQGKPYPLIHMAYSGGGPPPGRAPSQVRSEWQAARASQKAQGAGEQTFSRLSPAGITLSRRLAQ